MTTSPLHRHLASCSLFGDVPAERLAALEPGLARVDLPAGHDLVREGDPGDTMYVLVQGTLDVYVQTAAGGRAKLDLLRPGASVGELALITAQVRTATVTAREPAVLVELSRADFERLAGDQPGLYETVVRQAAPRLQRVQLGPVLEAWVGELESEELRDLQDRVQWVHLASGQTLFDQGDTSDGMYLVVSGRIRASRSLDDGSVASVEVGRGGSIGEIGLISDAPRAERAVALRDSHVVRITRNVAGQHPSFLIHAARTLVARTRLGGRTRQRPRTVAVQPVNPDAPGRAVADALARELSGSGRAAMVDAVQIDDVLGRRDACQAEPGSALDPVLTHWLNERETELDHLVFACDATDSPWTRRALRQADVVLLVAAASADPGIRQVERVARELCRDVQLALVHPDDTQRPEGTVRWLASRHGTTHHHVRLGDPRDLGRLARRLTGRAQGLVFSGGGARGYAHIGLIRALQERDVAIDMIGGTSMGAVVGGGFALTGEYDACYRAAASFGDPKRLLDRTLPIVALNRSRAVTELYRTMFGEARIEDLWTPFLCVSANLTRAEPVVHETGPLWEAVRASSAIPGVFTPLVRDGDLLVDGGVMNNFPVDLMRERVGAGIVIGSNAYAQNARQERYDIGTSVSGWDVLRQKLLPFGRKKHYPSMLSTLMRATSLSSKHLGEAAFALADLTIRYPTEDFGTLDFDRYDELIAIGYHVAQEVLEAWAPPDADGALRAA